MSPSFRDCVPAGYRRSLFVLVVCLVALAGIEVPLAAQAVVDRNELGALELELKSKVRVTKRSPRSR